MTVENSTIMNTLPLPVKVEMAEGTGDGPKRVKISGYAGNSVDLSDYGIDDPVVYNVAGIKYKNKIPYLFNHYDPIGHVENIVVTNSGVTGLGVHSDPGERSTRVATGIQNGLPYQASMGLKIKGDSVVYHAEGTVIVNGKEFQAPIHVVNESDMVELSAVLFGRDGETEITTLNQETRMLVLNSKTANQPDPPKETPATTPAPVPTPVNNQDPAPTPAVPPVVNNQNPPAPVPSTPQGIGMVEYAELAAKYPSHLTTIANAMKLGKDREGIENAIKLEKLENSHPVLPQSHRGNTTIENGFVARMAISMGVAPETIENHVGKPAADFANDQGSMGLREMLMHVANAEGGSFTGHSDAENLCNFVKRKVNNMEFSTINFPILMNRVAQWRLEESWKIGAPWAIGKIHESRMPDFRKAGRIRPAGGQPWDKVDKSGKLQHASFGEEVTYEVQTENHGQIITFKWEDVENDDIGLVNEMLTLMVEGAMMIPDLQLVRTIHEGRTNGFLVAGKSLFDLPLTHDNLEIVYNSVKNHEIQKGEYGVKTKFNTRWRLVVGEALEKTAWEIISQPTFVSGPGVPQGAKNFWYNRFNVDDTFVNFDNTTYHPSVDPYGWGLIPVAPQYAPYTIAFLRNMTKPTTQSVDLPGDMLGFGVRGYWPVKVQQREPAAVAWSFPGSAS